MKWSYKTMMLSVVAVTAISVSPVAAIGGTPVQSSPPPSTVVAEGATFVADWQPVLVSGSNLDAKYTWGWVTGTVYYNRAETRSLKTISYAMIVAAALCGVFGPATWGIACALSGAALAQWNYVASNAYGDGKCIKIKIPSFWAYGYSGGYCT